MPGIKSEMTSQSATFPPPITHPMDPRRGGSLSPRFATFLCWLLQLPPMAEPGITGISISGRCVFAATTADPYHNTLIGDWPDLERNLRGWGAVCAAEPELIDALVDKVRRAGR